MRAKSITQEILRELRLRVVAEGDAGIYGDSRRALRDIDALLACPNPSPDNIRGLLCPTANLQEVSIDGGWGDEFNELAATLERALENDS